MENVSVKQKSFWTSVIKGSIFAVTCSLLLILLFALIIRFLAVPDNLIMPINQIIKIVSIFVGCMVALKGSNRGIFKGAVIGLFYTCLAFLIFSFLSGSITFEIASLTDIAFGTIIGALSGMLAVNLRK